SAAGVAGLAPGFAPTPTSQCRCDHRLSRQNLPSGGFWEENGHDCASSEPALLGDRPCAESKTTCLAGGTRQTHALNLSPFEPAIKSPFELSPTGSDSVVD